MVMSLIALAGVLGVGVWMFLDSVGKVRREEMFKEDEEGYREIYEKIKEEDLPKGFEDLK